MCTRVKATDSSSVENLNLLVCVRLSVCVCRFGGWSGSVATNASMRVIPGGSCTGVGQYQERAFSTIFSADGTMLLCASQDGTVHFYDCPSWKKTREVKTVNTGWAILDLDVSRCVLNDDRIEFVASQGIVLHERVCMTRCFLRLKVQRAKTSSYTSMFTVHDVPFARFHSKQRPCRPCKILNKPQIRTHGPVQTTEARGER